MSGQRLTGVRYDDKLYFPGHGSATFPYHNRVPLSCLCMTQYRLNLCSDIRTCKYPERVDQQGLVVLAVNFDNRHLMTIYREGEIRVARNGDQAESVAIWYHISDHISILGVRTSLTATQLLHSPRRDLQSDRRPGLGNGLGR